MTEPTDDLQQRCAEVVEWQRTGGLPGDALRNHAAAHWAGRHDSLQMAERDTSSQAMQWIAKWGTPPAVAGEPVAWLSTDCIGERYLCFTKPNDSNPARPLVFGDTTPQPTQAQAGAVPLTCKWTHNADDSSWDTECGQSWRFDDGGPKENHMNFCHCCGKPLRIKGGQHGAE